MSTPSSPKINIPELIFAYLFPALFGKALILWLGSNYSMYPGEGYGYGLAAAISFTVLMAARLIWKYRHHKG